MKKFWPSPSWNAARRFGLLEGKPDSRCPIFAIRNGYCARAASGQARRRATKFTNEFSPSDAGAAGEP